MAAARPVAIHLSGLRSTSRLQRLWPDPLSESLGHEPPIRWVARHPDYDGPRVLRPEHLACNMAKHVRPDWEMPTDSLDASMDDDESEDGVSRG